MTLKGLIFDLDGTLVDTAPDLVGAANAVLRAVGRPAISEPQLRSIVGHGALVTVRKALELTGGILPDGEMQKLLGVYLDFYRDNIAVKSKVYEGLRPLLKKAQQRGLKLGVCTNKVESLSHKLLDEIGLAPFFDAVVGGDTLQVMKPDKAPYLEACRQLEIDAKESLMFGDSETDIRTAQNVGVPVIAVTFGYTPQPVSTFNPTHVIDHYDEAWALVAAA